MGSGDRERRGLRGGVPLPRTVRGLMVLLLVVIIVPALVVQGVLVYSDYQGRREVQRQRNLEMARAMSRLFSNYVEAIARQQRVLGAAILAIGNDHLAMQELLSEQTRQLTTVKTMVFSSPEGIVMAANDPAFHGIDISEREYFQDAIKAPRGQTVLSDLIQDRIDGAAVFTISQTVYDGEGKLLGVLTSVMDPALMSQRALHLQRTEGGSLVLYDRQGRLVHRDPDMELGWDQRDPALWWNEAVAEAFEGREGVTTWQSPADGEWRVVARVPVSRWGWVAGAGYRTEALSVGILRHLAMSVGLNLLVLAGLTAVALLVANRLTHAMRGLRDHVEHFDSRRPIATPAAVRHVREFDELATGWEDAVRRRQEAEEHLRQSHQRLSSILETISDGFLVLDNDWRITQFNRQAETYTGLAAAEAIGRDLWEVFPAAPGTVFEDNYRQAMETGRAVEFSALYEPYGKWYEVRAYPQAEGLAIFFRDVTARREAELLVRQARDLLNNVIESTPDLVAAIDLQYRFLIFNESYGGDFEKLFKYPAVMGESLLEILSPLPEQRDKAQMLWGRALAGETFSEVMEFGDPHLREYEMVFAPLRNEHGVVIGATEVARDVTERRRAEAALREAQESIARTEEFSLVMTLHVSLAGRWLKVPPTFCRFLGYEEDELLGQHIRDFSHPEDFKVDWSNVQRLLRGEINSFEMEKRFIRKDGSITWGYLNCSTVMDEKGRPVHLLTYVRDINHEKQAQRALKRYELLAAHTRDILLFVRDSDGMLIEANLAAEAAYGYGREELLALNIRDLRIDPPAEIRAQMRAAGNVGIQFETYHRRKDGSLFPVEVSSRGADIDGQKILLSVVRDISARRQAEESLRESEARLRFVLENSPDHMFVQDQDLCYLWVGRPLDPLKREDFIGHRDADIFGAEEAEAFDLAKRGVLAEGRPTAVVVPLMLHGRQRFLEARFEPWRDWSGNIMGLAGYVRDITENRRWAESLQRITDELRRSNEDLEQFAYVASHDLQEPLRMVTGFLDLLRTRFSADLSVKAMEYIAVAYDGASRMQRLIWDLLDFSRVTTRARELRPTSMETVLQGAMARLAGAVREADAEVTHDELPDVLGDETQLGQVLQNLIGNAVKFRQEDRKPQVHVGAEQVEGMVRFYVRDNGIGIDPRHRDRIFLIFQRLHTRERYPGTGIGLAVVKKIVERHGGTVSVESAVGQGATFYFTLRPAPAGGAAGR